MCFSALASFIASGVLSIVGFLSLWSSPGRKWMGVAFIPTFFAMQQFAEGLVWVYRSPTAAAVFLFFAFIVWPLYIPFSLFIVESDNEKRSLLYKLTNIGLGVSVCLLFGLLSSDMNFYVRDCHIVYDVAQAAFSYGIVTSLLAAAYCLVTIMPFFVSSCGYMKGMGLLVASSCLMAYFFYSVYFISVWCFFSAFMSTAILFIMHKNKEKK